MSFHRKWKDLRKKDKKTPQKTNYKKLPLKLVQFQDIRFLDSCVRWVRTNIRKSREITRYDKSFIPY
jgi:hypothetical protein